MSFWEWLMGTPDSPTSAPPARRVTKGQKRASVLGLQVGDMVSYDTVDYVVKNKLSYSDNGYEWFDYLMVDAATKGEYWLSVEEDDGLQLGLYRMIDLPAGLPPVPRSLTVEGTTYRQIEHAEAAVNVEREDPTRFQRSRVEYWEFTGPGKSGLTISRWGGQYEAAVGHDIQEYELRIFPAQV